MDAAARSIAGFCRCLRQDGFNLGLSETLDALRAAEAGLAGSLPGWRDSLRVLLCSRESERDRFDALFDSYWTGRGVLTPRSPRRRQGPCGGAVEGQRPLLASLADEGRRAEDFGARATGASRIERLRRTDFSRVPAEDMAQLERLAQRLALGLSLRLARRRRSRSRGAEVDPRRTVQRAAAWAGEPCELILRGPRERPLRIVALLDVSGSMDRFSLFLLRFLFVLGKRFPGLECFLFSTRLQRVTRSLKARRLPRTLSDLAARELAFSSGTAIGECLKRFNREFADRVLRRSSIVLILSDGLDTGSPQELGEQLSKLRQRVRRLIWLNPLVGGPGYEPLARGMKTALKSIDVLASARDLRSLAELERHLDHV